MGTGIVAGTAEISPAERPAEAAGWRRIMARRVGIIPLPVYVLLLALIAGLCARGKISGDVTVMIAILVAGGFTCAEIGKRIPLLNKVGGSSLVTIFLPSTYVVTLLGVHSAAMVCQPSLKLNGAVQ